MHEFVVMPDHFHVLITLDAEISIERAVQFIKGGFAFRAGREFGMPSPFWQKGFSEVRIDDRETYERVTKYIRDNPVRKGLAARPEEFPYSSASYRAPLDPPPQWLKPVDAAIPGNMAKAIS